MTTRRGAFSGGTARPLFSSFALPGLPDFGLVLRPLTQAGALHRGPALSPDGDLVSYASDRAGSFDIVVQQADSGRPVASCTSRARTMRT